MSAYSMNKRGWRLLVGLLFVATVVYLLRPSSFRINSIKHINNNEPQQISDEPIQLNHLSEEEEDILINKDEQVSVVEPEKMAFVTFLCDDVMGEATQVLVHSLTQTRTKHDIVVLVLDDVTQIVRKRLEHLGAKIIDVNQVKYPWDSSNARRKGFNKACRYSKLNLWNLTQYKKVVFLDADTMVVQPIDELFEYPQFTAAVDIGGVLNTGVFVAEPNVDTYNDIMATYENAPSYNRGDQGFLNYYFNKTAHPLPGNYNLMIKFTHFSTLAAGFVTKNTAKVLHFTSETKPWNFYFLHQREWHENYDGYLFGLWTRALRETRAKLSKGGLWTYNYGDEALWENSDRVKEICDHRLNKNYGRKYPKNKQFTVIINLNNASMDSNYFKRLLQHYSSSKKVARIFVNGNSFKNQQQEKIVLNSNYFKKLRLGKPVAALSNPFKTPNNKFNPIDGLQTDSVLLVDDNVLLSIKDMEYGYEVWKKNMDAAVGFFPDSHRINQSKKNIFVEGIDKAHYSMVQTEAMFIKSDFLYGYTCLLPEEIHHYIDQHPVCSGIAMNMLVSGQTGVAPVFVSAHDEAYKFEDKHAKTIRERSACIDDLSVLFNGKNPLLFNNDIVSRISSGKQYQPMTTLTWSNWAKSFASVNK